MGMQSGQYKLSRHSSKALKLTTWHYYTTDQQPLPGMAYPLPNSWWEDPLDVIFRDQPLLLYHSGPTSILFTSRTMHWSKHKKADYNNRHRTSKWFTSLDNYQWQPVAKTCDYPSRQTKIIYSWDTIKRSTTQSSTPHYHTGFKRDGTDTSTSKSYPNQDSHWNGNSTTRETLNAIPGKGRCGITVTVFNDLSLWYFVGCI
jgi:hypothetical protein